MRSFQLSVAVTMAPCMLQLQHAVVVYDYTNLRQLHRESERMRHHIFATY